MADSFDSPIDQGSLNRLYESLRRADARYAERLSQQERLEARAKTRSEGEERRVAREERVRNEPARGRSAETDERSAQAARRRLEADRASTAAARQRAAALDAEIAGTEKLTQLRTRLALLQQRAIDPRITDPRTYANQRPVTLPGEQLSRTAQIARQAEQAELAAERRALLQGGLVGNRATRLGLLTGAGGSGQLPPIRPPTTFASPPPPPPGLRQALGNERFAPQANVGAQAVRAEGDQLQYLARSARLSSDAFRRHGALTTEFISAAARGRVEFRELGFQVGATIAKFSGWTAAATAVYGVVAAFHELGTGAFASLNGVNLLQRIIPNLDTGAAQQQFRDLSREFALPIDDVAQAAYGQSKVFQDQKSTFEATRVALFAMKVGELDTATAQKTLTGIVQGFKLEAGDLPAVFDAINAAQNRFGGNTGQIARGVAQAAGQWQAAGGHYRSLISLIQTGSRLTGRTGVEIGTALQRMAEIVQRPNRRQQIVQLLGIDPQDHSIEEIVARAQKVLPTLSRSQQQVVANTLGTPQLSARILPILRNPELSNQIYGELDPAKVRGSAARELARAQQSPQFRIENALREFQRLGSALGESGAYQPLLTLVGGLAKGAEAATHLVEAFNELPGPLKTAVTYGGQLLAIVGLMRRFNVGGGFREGTAGRAILGRNPQALARAQILEGLDAEQTFLQEQRRGVVRRGGLLATQIPRSQETLTSLEAAGYEEGSAEERRVIALRERINTMQHELQVLIAEESAIVEAEIASQSTTNTFRKRTSLFTRARGESEEVARGLGIPYTQPLGTNVRAVPRPLLSQPGEVSRYAGPATRIGPGHVRFEGAVDAAILAESAEMARAQQQITANRGAFSRITQQSAILRGATNTTTRALGGARAAFGNIGTAFSGLGASLLLGLGPLDAILIGLPLLYEAQQHVTEKVRGAHAAVSRGTRAGAPEEIRSAAEDIRRKGEEIGSDLLAFNVDPSVYYDIARSEEQRAAAVQRAQGQRRLLAPSQVLADFRRNISESTNEADRERAVREAQREAASSLVGRSGGLFGARGNKAVGLAITHAGDVLKAGGAPGPQAKAVQAQLEAAIRQERADLAIAHGSLRRSLQALATPEDSAALVTSFQNRVARFGFNRGNQRRAGTLIAGLRRKLTQSASPQDTEKYLQQIDQVEQTVEQSINERLSRLTAQGAPPGQVHAARDAAIAQMRRATIEQTDKEIRAVERDIRANRRALRQARRDLDQQFAAAIATLVAASLPEGGPGVGGVGDAVGAVTRTLATSLAGVKAPPHPGARKARHELRALRRQQQQRLQAFTQAQDEQNKELDTSLFDAQTQLAQSRTADPVAQAQILVSRMRQRIGVLRRAGASIAEVDGAIAAYNQAVQQLASARLQRFQATLGRDSARASIGASQGAILGRALSDARRYAAAVRAQGSNVDPGEYINAQRAIYEAQKAIADYAHQQAQAMNQAQVAYRQSRTEDPVKQAIAALDGARRAVGLAQTPAERLQARADVNNRRRDVLHARQQRKFDDITFEADIGKIERDVEISRLETLLKTIHGNRELRRNIRRTIHQLKQDADNDADRFALNVGDIRLPTIYDVRRAIAGAGIGGRQTNVHVTNAPVFRIDGGGDVAGQVIGAWDRVVGTSTRAAARAAGVVGG